MHTRLMGAWHWRQQLLTSLWRPDTPPRWLRVGLSPLWLASQGYGWLARGHRALYTSGLCRRRPLPCPVVSIGNLTLGGTGKTPLTMWVARWYQQQGWRVAILSRGYGARRLAAMRVVSTGAGPLCPWQEAGDEPYLLAQALPGVAVLIGRERHRTGQYACAHLGADVLILDDGFQHHALQRDLDVVLIDVSNPFGPGSLVPRGILREPLDALAHADALVLTRVELASEALPGLCQQLQRWNTHAPLERMATSLEAVHCCATGHAVDLAALRQHRAVAFVGIGNPWAFVSTLQQLSLDVATLLVFPDHHPYTLADWHTIGETLRQERATVLITTEKDAVRLDPAWQASMPLHTLRIGVTFADAAPGLTQQLHELMAHATPR